MIAVDRRPNIAPIPPYNATVTEYLTFHGVGGTYIVRGETALREYSDNYRGRGLVLHHGSNRSPQEIGLELTLQQAYSKHNTVRLTPHGKSAISASESPKFPIVRSLFHRDAPALVDYPRDEFLLANRTDVTGREFTIVTKEALEAVRKANSTGYVYVLHEFQPDGTRAERFQEPDGIGHEYRFYQPVRPAFVMAVTVEDLPLNTIVARDYGTAKKISDNMNSISPEYFAYRDSLQDIYGDPFFDWMYLSI